eukprot:NODE_56_length_25944_cov_0.235287.p11 type:complete len:203 gc:universal NODE_56_length_25944_cov_0.235287:17993-17385(-)
MVLMVKSKTKYFIEQRTIYSNLRRSRKEQLIKNMNEKTAIKWKKASDCYICNLSFGFLRRRHHCRLCGNSIGDECLKILQNEKTCKTCFHTITNKEKIVEDPMKPLFESVEALKRQLLEILPYFNGLVIELKSSNEKEKKELHVQASVLRLQLTSLFAGIERNINLLKRIEAGVDYKKCIDNYIKSIHLFMQSFAAPMRSFK